MPALSSRLFVRMMFIYAITSLLVAAGMILSNRYVSGYEGQRLWNSVFHIAAGIGLWIVVAGLFTRYRLRGARAYLEGTDRSPDATVRAWNALIRFPHQLFWLFLLYGFMTSQAYYIAELAFSVSPVVLRWAQYIKSFLFNLTTMPGVALMYYGLLRRLLRPYLPTLPVAAARRLRFDSFMRPMIAAFLCAVMFTVFRLAWYAIGAGLNGRTIGIGTALSIAGAASLLCLVIYIMLNASYLRELRDITARMRHALSRHGHDMHGNIPIFSLYETGELAAAYNELQDRLSSAYAQLEKELTLAGNVQKRLLSNVALEVGSWRAYGLFRSGKAVGSHFFDIVRLDDARFAVMAGRVAGSGMPAALVMSAFLFLFRSEVRQERSARGTLDRLNRRMAEAARSMYAIDAAVCLVDVERGELEVAVAGAIAPIVVRAAGPEWLRPVGERLGRSPDTHYGSTAVSLGRGECVVLASSQTGGEGGFPAAIRQVMPGDAPDREPEALLAGFLAGETDCAAVWVGRRREGREVDHA